MIDLQKANEWQKRDEETGLLFPWLVESFLEELKTWDLKNKKVYEIGLGASTVWWSRECMELYGVDNNKEYFQSLCDFFDKNGDGSLMRMIIGVREKKEDYIGYITVGFDLYDIIIVDGDPVEWRDDCIKAALNCINKGGKLIVDNWLQPSVWMASEETQALLRDYPSKIYKQESHPDWQTAVFDII